MRREPILVLLLAALTVSATPGLAQGTFTVRPQEDLIFTDIKRVEDLAPLGDGYAAATRGGLALWWGEDPRTVMTRMDGLPSNVVWSVAPTGEELLVGTEIGAALVDPAEASAEPLDVPDEVRNATDGHVIEVSVTETGSWAMTDRDGDVALRTPDGTWTAAETPTPPRTDASAFYADADHVLLGDEHGSVYELTDGNTWEQLLKAENPIASIAVYDGRLFIGLERGGLHVYDMEGERQEADLPEKVSPDRFQALTILTQRVHDGELWIGTPLGYAVYDASQDAWRVVDHDELPNRWIEALMPLEDDDPDDGHDRVALGTLQGVGWPRFDVEPGAYELHTGANGPITSHMTGASARDGEVWVPTQKGISVFFPEARTWANLGEASGIPFERVTSVEFDEKRGIAWMGALGSVLGLNVTNRTWHAVQDQEPFEKPANIYFDIELDGDYIWMPENRNGLLRYDIEENTTRRYDIEDGLLSRALTCADRWNEFLVVCAQDVLQVFNLTQRSPEQPLGPSYDFCSGPRCDNYPSNGTLAALPDGNQLWLGTDEGGVVRLERNVQEGLEVTGHWSVDEGLPAPTVRSLAPAPEGIWVGTVNGLALLEPGDGVVETWGREEGFDAPVIQGLAEHDGILYVATLSGLYRLDLGTRELLPLFETGGEFGPPQATVRIGYPPSGATLSSPVNMTGTVTARGTTVEDVQVRIDGGPWTNATGTSSWRYRLPVDDLAPGGHTTTVRALGGGETLAEKNLTFQTREPSEDVGPPTLQHTPLPQVRAGDPLPLDADVNASRPIAIDIEARIDGELERTDARVVGGHASAVLSIPSDAEGQVEYQFHVRSGGGEATFPEDGYYTVPIEPQRVRDIFLRMDPSVRYVEPGNATTVEVQVFNAGNVDEEIRLTASGLRPSWITFDTEELTLSPESHATVTGTVTVPRDASPTDAVLLITAETLDGVQLATGSIPVRSTGAAETRSVDDGTGDDIPAPGPALALAAVAVAGWVASRRRRGDR